MTIIKLSLFFGLWCFAIGSTTGWLKRPCSPKGGKTCASVHTHVNESKGSVLLWSGYNKLVGAGGRQDICLAPKAARRLINYKYKSFSFHGPVHMASCLKGTVSRDWIGCLLTCLGRSTSK
jgi:hypothetical protein